LEVQDYALVGNGMWASYFEPVLPIPRLDSGDCPSVPMFQLSYSQASAGMHQCSDLAIRAWPYLGIPMSLMPRENQSMHDWLWQNRKRAAPMVQKYYHPLSWLQQRIQKANLVNDRKCMSMHVRLTDKANGRDKKDVGAYLPYATTFASVTGFEFPIYLATDDSTIVSHIRQALSPAIVLMQENVVRSESETPTFELLQNDTHRSNTEALVEIYSMAKCSYFVHGYSAMAEAVVYISPDLHEGSINVDDPARKGSNLFRKILLRNKVHLWQAGDQGGTNSATRRGQQELKAATERLTERRSNHIPLGRRTTA